MGTALLGEITLVELYAHELLLYNTESIQMVCIQELRKVNFGRFLNYLPFLSLFFFCLHYPVQTPINREWRDKFYVNCLL